MQNVRYFAAREHGDARRALDLLRVAAELAEREQNKMSNFATLTRRIIRLNAIKCLTSLKTNPASFSLCYILSYNFHSRARMKNLFTGDIYNRYQLVCEQTKNEILTQRRVSDILAEFDMLGLINAQVISRGREGRTREIRLMVPKSLLPKAGDILRNSLDL